VATRFTILDSEVKKIEAMAGIGLNVEEIASIYGVSKSTLTRGLKKNRAARDALLKGRSDAKKDVFQTAYEMATSGKCPTMTIFWLKCRAGWKEPKEEDLPPPEEAEEYQIEWGATHEQTKEA
jgi:hypothetical protein